MRSGVLARISTRRRTISSAQVGPTRASSRPRRAAVLSKPSCDSVPAVPSQTRRRPVAGHCGAERGWLGSSTMPETPRHAVLIVGGGVAGLEAMLALRDLAPHAAEVTLV